MKNTSQKRAKGPTMLGIIVCLGTFPLLCGITGCSTGKTETGARSTEEYPSMVGPPGADGPAGPEGAKGQVGAAGAPGAGVAGATGKQGPSGPIGVAGRVG